MILPDVTNIKRAKRRVGAHTIPVKKILQEVHPKWQEAIVKSYRKAAK